MGFTYAKKNVYGRLQWNQVQFWLTEVLCIDDTHFHANVCMYTHKQRHKQGATIWNYHYTPISWDTTVVTMRWSCAKDLKDIRARLYQKNAPPGHLFPPKYWNISSIIASPSAWITGQIECRDLCVNEYLNNKPNKEIPTRYSNLANLIVIRWNVAIQTLLTSILKISYLKENLLIKNLCQGNQSGF